jgi:hypothetical protein
MGNYNILKDTLSCKVLLYACLNFSGSECSINDLGVIMDKKMNFLEHVDVMLGKVFAILRFMRILSFKFKDPYTEVSLHVFGSFEVELCQTYVYSPFYDARVDKVERIQGRFIRYDLHSSDWPDIYDLPPP